MSDLVSRCDGENAVLQVDFSENAAIASQFEIQSAHWNHGAATLFTDHVWISDSESESIVLVSDDLNHTKYSVYVFMDYIINHLKKKFSSINTLNIFSDGAGSQAPNLNRDFCSQICTIGNKSIS